MNINKDNPVMVNTVKMATVAAGTAEELAIFVAPFDCFLRKIYITNDVTLSAADTNYTTISFQRKGTGGDGTDEIASIATGPAATGSTLTARVPKDVGALHKTYRFIPKGTAVTYKKADEGSGAALTDPIFSVEYQKA